MSKEPRELRAEDLNDIEAELKRWSSAGSPLRWNADPDEVRKAVAKLVLTLAEFIRKLMERQALRRMDEGTLNPAEVENVGLALLRLEETLKDLAEQFGLSPDELNLDLGPFGRLM